MTSALKACLRRNPDESGLLRDNMDDGNSKKILSVSQFFCLFPRKQTRRCQRSLCGIQCIKHNDVVAILASLHHFCLYTYWLCRYLRVYRYLCKYCLHESWDFRRQWHMSSSIHIIKINELCCGSRLCAELQLNRYSERVERLQPQITHQVKSNYFYSMR